MKRWLWGFAALALAACARGTAPGAQEVKLQNYGAAPELNNEVWLNADKPLRLAELRGKVVLIDFWTFG